jgi:FliI/YscN family ATPase
VGDFCEVVTSSGRRIRVQVIGFRDGHVLSMPLEEIDGIQLHDRVIARQDDAQVAVGPDLLNRVLDGFGRPIDRKPPIRPAAHYRLYSAPGSPLDREHITRPITTGIRAIDTIIPVGQGQRMGIFGGSGVGKSTLLGAMSRHNSADVTVIALIGERNREVRAFLEHEMGEEGSKRSVVVCSTSDRPAPLRVRACFVALAIAEYFRDQGANVLFIMDSVTRLAMAQREIGLAAGEPPSQKGETFRRAPSRAFSRCWWKATTSTNPSAMPCAPSWTGISFFRAGWRPLDITRPSTFCTPLAVSPHNCPRPCNWRRRGKFAKLYPPTRIRGTSSN